MKLLHAVRLACLLTCIATPAWADDWVYTLRPGDQLWTIARDFCGSSNRATSIAAHNGLTNPAAIRAGQRINIPTAWLAFAPTEARIERVSGDASIVRDASGGPQQAAARVGDRLQMGDSVLTGSGAAVVSFADGSTLAIQPDSRVLFNKLTAFGPAGMVDTHLRFVYGRGDVTVEPQNRGDRFRIQTPEGIAAVRGTQFRVGHNSDVSASNTETLEGFVQFQSPQASTDLPGGFGAVASQTGVIKQALLPAPQILHQGGTIAAQQTLSWAALPGASAYNVTWADGNAADIVIRQYKQPSTSTLVSVAPGSYELRVRGISAAGVEGFDARRTLAVLTPAPSLATVAAQQAGRVQLAWVHAEADTQFSLELSAKHWPQPRVVTVTGNAYTADLEAGAYTWRVNTVESAIAEPQSFTLHPNQPSGLAARRQQQRLQVDWAAQEDADYYLLRITSPDGTVLEEQIRDTSASVPAPAFGTYRITLAAVQNALQSDPSAVQVQVYRRPWWLIAIFSILAV